MVVNHRSRAAGWAHEDSEQVAEVYLDSELRAHESHGVFGLSRLLGSTDQSNPRREVRVLRETETALLLDGAGSEVVADITSASDSYRSDRATMRVLRTRCDRETTTMAGNDNQWEYTEYVNSFEHAPRKQRTETVDWNPILRRFNKSALEVRSEAWMAIRVQLLRDIESWRQQGWEPTGEVGPDCLVIEEEHKGGLIRGILGGGSFTHINYVVKEIRIPMRRKSGS